MVGRHLWLGVFKTRGRWQPRESIKAGLQMWSDTESLRGFTSWRWPAKKRSWQLVSSRAVTASAPRTSLLSPTSSRTSRSGGFRSDTSNDRERCPPLRDLVRDSACESSSARTIVKPDCSARISGGHFPRTGVHLDATGILIFGEFGLQRGSDLVVALFRQIASLAVDLTCRTNRELESDGIVQILSDEHLGVDFLEYDIFIARDFELLGPHLCSPSRTGQVHRPARSHPGPAEIAARSVLRVRAMDC